MVSRKPPPPSQDPGEETASPPRWLLWFVVRLRIQNFEEAACTAHGYGGGERRRRPQGHSRRNISLAPVPTLLPFEFQKIVAPLHTSPGLVFLGTLLENPSHVLSLGTIVWFPLRIDDEPQAPALFE